MKINLNILLALRMCFVLVINKCPAISLRLRVIVQLSNHNKEQLKF